MIIGFISQVNIQRFWPFWVPWSLHQNHGPWCYPARCKGWGHIPHKDPQDLFFGILEITICPTCPLRRTGGFLGVSATLFGVFQTMMRGFFNLRLHFNACQLDGRMLATGRLAPDVPQHVLAHLGSKPPVKVAAGGCYTPVVGNIRMDTSPACIRCMSYWKRLAFFFIEMLVYWKVPHVVPEVNNGYTPLKTKSPSPWNMVVGRWSFPVKMTFFFFNTTFSKHFLHKQGMAQTPMINDLHSHKTNISRLANQPNFDARRGPGR